MKKKRIKIIIIGLLAMIFVILNIFWYIGVFRAYFLLQSKMTSNPNYVNEGIVDEEGYSCYVKFPTYLYWKDGNLSIGSPMKEIGDAPEGEDKKIYAANGGSVIIWLKHFSGDIKELGVILEQDGVNRQIYLVDSATARYEDDQPYVDAGQDEINKLFKKAEDVWDLEMPWKK